MTYPQQGGYGPQQGGYGPPQQGGYGPPQQGGYGPQGGYPQGGYGPPQQPGGYGPYPPPQKNNNGLIIGIVASVVVVAVVALVLVLVLNGDDDDPKTAENGTSQDSGGDSGAGGPGGDSGDSGGGDSDGGSGGSASGVSSPEDLAEIVVRVVENKDEDLIDEHACSSSDAASLKSEMSRLDGLEVTATVDDVQESGDAAQARIVVEFQGQTEGFTVEMEKKDDSWCVSGI